MLVDRVIAALEAFDFTVAFPSLNPIGFDGSCMLHSSDNSDQWNVNYSNHGWAGILFMMNSVQLISHEGYTVTLTKEQKKRLTKAFIPAMNKAHADWKARNERAAL